MAKGCLLSLIATLLSFLLLFPLQEICNRMDWQAFNGAGLHAGTWIVAWPLLFLMSYCLLLAIDRPWRARSKQPKR
jgi:hypothetical protein